jgi:REP element-mobilizing transposase RayT
MIVLSMDRYWFLTWTTYATWLPGDSRGSVTTVSDGTGPRIRHNQPGTPYDPDMPGLRHSAADHLKGAPVYLQLAHAEVLITQFQETCRFRGWELLAAAVMRNHCHVVLGVPGDPEPDALLRDLKSYGSRALNRKWPKPVSGTWWTESGSKRKLPNRPAIAATVHYVTKRQEFPLLVWPGDNILGERGALAP